MSMDELERAEDKLWKSLEARLKNSCPGISPKTIDTVITGMTIDIYRYELSSSLQIQRIDIKNKLLALYKEDIEKFFTAVTAKEIAENPVLKSNMKILEALYKPRLEVYESIFSTLCYSEEAKSLYREIEEKYKEDIHGNG